ncbi:hypothetical protein SCP_0200310 [Sparassis crispa]|uniref:Uncharacterized protein n=1 Tax=Sparassis crispa TaxID=139825 RepID=A0A401G9I5_9APHY|nr:hypothetical protein SCP_0200310 [Sparassis crispa]GBE78834.1 hypothetical protein SCP_0200310 [Sparassis crispa]
MPVGACVAISAIIARTLTIPITVAALFVLAIFFRVCGFVDRAATIPNSHAADTSSFAIKRDEHLRICIFQF